MKLTLAALAAVRASAYSFGTLDGADGWIEDHNYFRCQHGASPVAWDTSLADKAQTWAQYMADTGRFTHSDSSSTSNYPNSLAHEMGGSHATGISGSFPSSGENIAYASSAYTATCGDYSGPYGQHCVVNDW